MWNTMLRICRTLFLTFPRGMTAGCFFSPARLHFSARLTGCRNIRQAPLFSSPPTLQSTIGPAAAVTQTTGVVLTPMKLPSPLFPCSELLFPCRTRNTATTSFSFSPGKTPFPAGTTKESSISFCLFCFLSCMRQSEKIFRSSSPIHAFRSCFLCANPSTTVHSFPGASP